MTQIRVNVSTGNKNEFYFTFPSDLSPGGAETRKTDVFNPLVPNASISFTATGK